MSTRDYSSRLQRRHLCVCLGTEAPHWKHSSITSKVPWPNSSGTLSPASCLSNAADTFSMFIPCIVLSSFGVEVAKLISAQQTGVGRWT